MRLQLVGLAELPATHSALVRLLAGVHQQVAVVVLRRPELFAAVLAVVRFDTCVQKLVLLQLRCQQEAFVTDSADVWPVAAVLPQVVQVQVTQVEGFPTCVAGELFVLGVALLVRAQRAAAAEALWTDFTAERFDSGGPPPARLPAGLSPIATAAVNQLLVLLQLAVVEERLSAQVAHERLCHAVNKHVSLQSPGPREAFATLITPEEGRTGEEGSEVKEDATHRNQHDLDVLSDQHTTQSSVHRVLRAVCSAVGLLLCSVNHCEVGPYK